MVGPLVGERECTLGVGCVVSVAGYRLDASNQIVALSSGTCGSPNASVVTATWDKVNPNSTVNGSGSTYDLGTPSEGVAGSYFRLCWAHNPSMIADFKYEIDGDFELAGPFVGELNCTLGISCAMPVTGYRLAASNKIVAISSGACGDAAAVVVTDTWDVS